MVVGTAATVLAVVLTVVVVEVIGGEGAAVAALVMGSTV